MIFIKPHLKRLNRDGAEGGAKMFLYSLDSNNKKKEAYHPFEW